MAEQVTLPGVGPVSKKAMLLGGGAAAVVMTLLWWRKRHTAAAAPAAAADPNALDPGADFGSGMAGGGGALVGPSPSSVPAAPATNAQWQADALQKLAFEDPSPLAKVLGLYLTGKAVTPDQESLIDEAIGAAGYPPVAGPNGYPPAIRTQPAGGQKPPPPPAVSPPGAPDGASARPTSSTTVDIWWHPVEGARGYTAWIRRRGSNDVWTTVGTTFDTFITARGLTPGTAYEAVARANSAAGYGPYSATVYVTTPK